MTNLYSGRVNIIAELSFRKKRRENELPLLFQLLVDNDLVSYLGLRGAATTQAASFLVLLALSERYGLGIIGLSLPKPNVSCPSRYKYFRNIVITRSSGNAIRFRYYSQDLSCPFFSGNLTCYFNQGSSLSQSTRISYIRSTAEIFKLSENFRSIFYSYSFNQSRLSYSYTVESISHTMQSFSHLLPAANVNDRGFLRGFLLTGKDQASCQEYKQGEDITDCVFKRVKSIMKKEKSRWGIYLLLCNQSPSSIYSSCIEWRCIMLCNYVTWLNTTLSDKREQDNQFFKPSKEKLKLSQTVNRLLLFAFDHAVKFHERRQWPVPDFA